MLIIRGISVVGRPVSARLISWPRSELIGGHLFVRSEPIWAQRIKAGRYSAFGPVSGRSGFFDASLPAGIEVEPLASVRGCPPEATSVPS